VYSVPTFCHNNRVVQSVNEAAGHLRIDTIYRWIERKKLPAHRVGRLWKFKGSEVDAWVRSGGAGGTRETGKP
jgi:excisionase family DNA binding protein